MQGGIDLGRAMCYRNADHDGNWAVLRETSLIFASFAISEHRRRLERVVVCHMGKRAA